MDETTPMPTCVGIILDGNRRWAKAKGLSGVEGHKAGADNLEKIAKHLSARGVQHLVVYAFSTENWNRSEEEVSYLMKLIEMSQQLFKRIASENVRIRFVGELARVPEATLRTIREIEEVSKNNTGKTFWVCFSYGGRAEVIAAAKELQKSGEEITEESFKGHMWTAEMPDPDLIIRTSGEKRLSNFLLWQGAYSELFFTDTYWPDFSPEEFDRILAEYAVRERRHGK